MLCFVMLYIYIEKHTYATDVYTFRGLLDVTRPIIDVVSKADERQGLDWPDTSIIVQINSKD